MSSDRKTALLHYWLTGMRGGENVLNEFCRLFPDAEIFTHAAIPANLTGPVLQHKLHESLIARLPGGRTHCQKYLPLMPLALKKWDFSSYDLIISSESGPVKGINKPANIPHICYCHTPMRYVWDLYDTYYNQSGLLGKLAMRTFRKTLQHYDLKSAECVDFFIANSQFVKERIRRIYGRDALVVHPPVDTEFFQKTDSEKRDIYLFAGQLVPYKHPDIVLKAFSVLNREKLIIVGQGPMKKYLQKIATPNVTFCSNITREELRKLYASAKALLFPGIEDFGIVPVEAQAAGCPVIAMGKGGALETVIPGKTGLFMKNQSPEDLLNCIEESAACTFDPFLMQQHIQQFSIAKFHANISGIIQKLTGSALTTD